MGFGVYCFRVPLKGHSIYIYLLSAFRALCPNTLYIWVPLGIYSQGCRGLGFMRVNGLWLLKGYYMSSFKGSIGFTGLGV